MACLRNSLNLTNTSKCLFVIQGNGRNFSVSSVAQNENSVAKKEYSPITFKRGTGRQSVSGNTVTVFGATGMVGRILCNRLGKEGTQIIVPYRGDIHDARPLKLTADLGQLYFQEIDIRDTESIREAVQYSNMVVNCIGTDYETSNFSYHDVNVQGARNIAKMCREAGVSKLVHFSALNASLNPQKIYFKQSEYLRSKYMGELAVKEEFDDAVIVRPSNIYGETDRFLFNYIHDYRRGLTSIPLWNRGEMTIKMPVHQSNVADGVMKILHDKDIRGATYDFVGPKKYLLSEIVDYIFQRIQRPNIKRQFMTPTRLAITYAYEKIMKRPQFNFDLLEREFISDTLSPDTYLQLKDLGVEFKDFESMVAWHLKVFNKLSYYNEKFGEFSEPKAPTPLSEDYELQLRRKIRQQ